MNGLNNNYRYGFQGQEKDDEIKGAGNSVNYKYRMHDPRVGRFFAIDPLFRDYPHYSPYVFSGNEVIQFNELEGLEPTKFLVKLASGAWKQISKSTFNTYVKNGSAKWLKVEGKQAQQIARKNAEKIHGKKTAHHTSHTIAKNSNKITKPHYQNSTGGGTKIFYKASAVMAAPAGVDNKTWTGFWEDLAGETILFTVELLLGGSSVAHAPSNNPYTDGFVDPPPMLYSGPIGYGEFDRDGDGNADGSDFICNACGPDGENLIRIGQQGENLIWHAISSQDYGKIKKGGEAREKVFNDAIESYKAAIEGNQDQSGNSGESEVGGNEDEGSSQDGTRGN